LTHLLEEKNDEGEFVMAEERLLVIGGDAAGMSAASQARRQRPELEIVAFERSPHTSSSA
jgi:succinate dehydrogenase/fumarate reductase flavoprotein subunit